MNKALKVNAVVVELGLNAQTTPDLDTLTCRAKARLKITAGGQEKLEFLNHPDAATKSPLDLDESGGYVIAVPIPSSPDRELIPHPPRRGVARGRIVRDDDQEKQADLVTALIQKSADLVEDVATVLATTADPQREVKKLERQGGVDTKPARQFLHGAQDDFKVQVDGAEVDFNNQNVRRRVQVAESLRLTVKIQSGGSFPILNGKVQEVLNMPHEEESCKLIGVVRQFKFSKLGAMQSLILKIAGELGFAVEMETDVEISTCTLQYRPHEVKRIFNFRELAGQTLEAIQAFAMNFPDDAANDLGNKAANQVVGRGPDRMVG